MGKKLVAYFSASGTTKNVAEIIVQTAGRNALGEFAPEFAHFMQAGQKDGQCLILQKI